MYVDFEVWPDGYALIQAKPSTLAAHATGGSFYVLSDSRRPDLIEAWYRTMRAVRPFELRCRLKLLMWQELATALTANLQLFLAAKYGIVCVKHSLCTNFVLLSRERWHSMIFRPCIFCNLQKVKIAERTIPSLATVGRRFRTLTATP